jgi:hypothetical protein
MEDLIILESNKTARVNFSAKGKLEIGGKSIPENAIEFFKPIYIWLDTYKLTPNSETNCEVKFEYFNTSSSKCLLDIFRKLESINNSGLSKITVNWMYDDGDEDMLEAGDDFKSLVDLPFEFIKLSS